MKNESLNTSVWLSCYIYYNDSPDDLLIKKISPLVQKILKNKKTEQFFFIRYSDKKGPHIRLRFKGEKSFLQQKIKPLLAKHFLNCRFVTYRPEFTRYGGKQGVLLAEKIFASSSKTVLSFLEESESSSYEDALGFALQFNLSAVYALGMDKAEVLRFFNHFFSRKDSKIFAKNLKEQQAIIPFLSNLWSALEQHTIFDKQWFNQWIKEISVISNAIQNKFKENKFNSLDPKKTHQQNPLWYLYESYIHMNNNRLGIHTADESYIAYIISKALSYEE